MNVACQSCGRSVDHASPGCAEHARREAENIHVAHLASDTGAEHCPLCTAPAAANRAERRQGMGAEVDRLRERISILNARLEAAHDDNDRLRRERDEARDEVERAEPRRQRDARDIADADAEVARLRAELASAQQTIREWREQTARTNNEVAELLPDDLAAWGPGDVAYALVQARDALTAAREDVALLRTRSCEAAATIDGLRADVERLTLALSRAHHTLREWGPGCSHPECSKLAPLRCDDCLARFCDDHDSTPEGHDLDAGPLPHAVGPDDLRCGSAMREAGAS